MLCLRGRRLVFSTCYHLFKKELPVLPVFTKNVDLYELAELVVLNAELWERQEEDDAAEAQHQTTRLKAGTKSRRIVIPDAVPTTPPTSLVETFVEEKALLVSERQKVRGPIPPSSSSFLPRAPFPDFY